MITTQRLKYHLKIDESDSQEDVYLQLLLDAAAQYIEDLTGIANDVDAPPQFEVALLLLVSHWYVNREAVSEVNTVKVPYGFQSILHSLRTVGSHF